MVLLDNYTVVIGNYNIGYSPITVTLSPWNFMTNRVNTHWGPMIFILLVIKKNFSSEMGKKTHMWLSGELVIGAN